MKNPIENPFGRLMLESYFQQFAISCTFPALAPVTFRQGYQQPTLSLPLMAFTALSALLPLFAFCLLLPMWIRFWPIENFQQYRLCVSVQTFRCDIMFFARKISSAHWFYLPKLF